MSAHDVLSLTVGAELLLLGYGFMLNAWRSRR